MWKYLVLLVLVQRRTIFSQPVIDENMREARQLNFGDCCPCPGSERSIIRDEDVLDSQMQVLSSRDDCPCMTADSDAASSVFRPAMRAVEPFKRPREINGEPKPLLKPEVGLASSVLETLREVTDQEYQEALARDAARSAIDASQVNSFEQETGNYAPKKIVNIILKPKQTNDTMPEASHVQETRCVHLPLGQSSDDDSVGHSVPLFRNSLLSSPKVKNNALLHKKLFDMNNSASNIQENVRMPLKSNILDDLKLKSDLIKLKLFPEIGNNLKGDIKTESENARISNLRLPSLIDHFKKSKDKDYPPLRSIDNIGKEKEKDAMYSPSNSEQYVLNNNARSYKNPQTFLHSKKPYKEMDTSNSVKSKPSLHFNTNEENLKGVTDNTVLSEISDCELNLNEGDDENSNIINTIDTLTSDIASSPSEIIETKSSMSTEVSENRMNYGCDTDDNENELVNQNKIDDNKQQLTSDIEETIPTNLNECLSEENTEMDQSNNFAGGDKTYKGEESLCNFEDPDVEASVNNPKIISLQEEDNKYDHSNVGNEPRNVNTQSLDNQQTNDITTLITTTEKILVDSTPKSNTLPNIKDNILKTIENFKKTNERIQEKIKSNVQDALQLLVVKNNPVVETDSSPNNGLSEEESNKVGNNINLQDLQEMSNRILNLSSLKEEEEAKASSQSRENLTKDTKYHNGEQAGDNSQETSKLNTISLSAESPSEIFKSATTSPKTSLENSNELMERSSLEELKETSRNPLLSSCDNMSLKSSDPVKTEADLSDDQNNEMFSQASSPIVSSIQHVIQPNTNSNVKAFFENFQTSVSEIFNSDTKPNIFSAINDNANDDSITNAIFTKNQQLLSDEPLARLNSDKSRKVKNPSSNINLYKAKVAVPKSLNIKALPEPISQEPNALSKFHRKSPEMIAASNTLREHMDTLSPNNLKSKIGNSNQRRDNSELKTLKFNGLQNIMPNSDHFHSLTENTLRNIQDAFDENLKNPFTRNYNKMLSKERPVDLFETIAKTNDEFTEKFRAFHSGLNERLSSFSQKISNISPLQVHNDHTFRGIKNNNLKQLRAPTAISRTSLLDLEKTNNSKPKILQKFNIPSKHVALDSKKIPTITRPTKLRVDEIKSSLRKDIKLKPLKESKVTISFSTTARPKLISKTKTSSLPSSVKSKTSLLTKNSLLKRPQTKSKLKTGESKALASEQIASRIPFSDRSFVNSRKLSSLYERTSDLHDTNTRSNSDFEEAIPSERKSGSSVLFKIREAAKAKATEDAANEIIKNSMFSSSRVSDASLSASNINSMVLEDRPLKENVSYKCKMMCFEDSGNS
ncbi:unnamed protein product, partial [Brenthis ino]